MQIINWNKQAILAATLLVLGTTAYWLEFKHKPDQESKEELNKKLFNLKDVQVKEIVFHDGVGHVFDLRCSDATSNLCKPGENSKWELTQPIKLKADDSNANALISTLNNLTIAETIDLKDETPEKRAALLKEYGLDAQARTLPGTRQISVETPSGTTVLYLGQVHPIGDNIFGIAEIAPGGQKATGKVDENKIYLVPTYFKANFEHDLTFWRDKKLLAASAHEIESFELQDPKTKKAPIQAVRKDGQWTLKTAKDGEVPGDIENIDNLLTAATFLSAKSFVSDDKKDDRAKAALKASKAVVTLTMQREKGTGKELPEPIVLTLFQKGEIKPATPKKGVPAKPASGQIFATVSNMDPLYELELTSLDRLNKEVKDLRLAKLMTSMERFAVKKIEIAGNPVGAPITFKDSDGKWVKDEPKSAPTPAAPVAQTENEKVQNMLDKLSGNRILDFLTGAAIPGGEAEGLTVKLEDDKGAIKRQLSFWKNGGKIFARDLASARKEAFRVDVAMIDALPWSSDYFEKKTEPPKLGGMPMTGPGAPPPRGLPAGAVLPPGFPGRPGMPPGMPPGMAGAPPEPGKPLIPQPAQKK